MKRDETYPPAIFSTHGRIGRLRYFAYSMIYNMLTLFIAGIATAVLIPALSEGSLDKPGDSMLWLVMLFNLPLFLAFFIAARRRLHDLNITSWLALFTFVPFINMLFFLYLLIWPGTPDTNNYGPRPQSNSILLLLMGSLGTVAIIGMLAAIAIPAYKDYVQRAQQAQIQTP
ncbi:hypothetical protein A9Q99_25060 [Gammaproteobacteria bacterium 45_16_T64]|nr:hypothetical protein A9Q99_25060 [Gammaproteobacteria bacterium 45_16_T64]